MKTLFKVGNFIFYIIVSITLISAIGSAVLKKPVLMTSVRSNSMYPSFQRGDIIFLNPFFPNHDTKIGDIIVFKTDGGSYDTKGWIVHRIIEGNLEAGYITKGDANDYTDQSSDNPSIKAEWIAGRVAVIGSKPLKMPLLGQLPLLMEKYSKTPYTLPVLALIIGLIMGISEFFSKKKRKVIRENLDIQSIYFFSGITIAILMFGTMLSTGQNLKINYEVSKSTNGVIIGSKVGILRIGEIVEKPLSELNNKGFIPTTAVITTDDNQITLSHQKLLLTHGMQVKPTMTVNALKPGKYNSTIHVGMFFPLLPENLIYSLAKKSYWLALIIVSIIPGLPIMLYPLINSTLRRKTIRTIRHKLIQLKIKLTLISH